MQVDKARWGKWDGAVTPSEGERCPIVSLVVLYPLAGGTAVALAGLGLVGCGGSSSSDTSSTTSASSDSSAKALSGTVNCSGATSFQLLVEAAASSV